MSTLSTYATFLTARWDEMGKVAQASHYDGQRWIPEEEAVVAADKNLDPLLFLDRKRDAIHAANWSPAFVLADLAAKRAMLRDCRLTIEAADDREGQVDDERRQGGATVAEAMLEHLAAPFRDHPDHPANQEA